MPDMQAREKRDRAAGRWRGGARPFDGGGDAAAPCSGVVTLDGKAQFQAIYAEVATAQSCIGCHRDLAGTATGPYQVGDVLGGLIITFRIEG